MVLPRGRRALSVARPGARVEFRALEERQGWFAVVRVASTRHARRDVEAASRATTTRDETGRDETWSRRGVGAYLTCPLQFECISVRGLEERVLVHALVSPQERVWLQRGGDQIAAKLGTRHQQHDKEREKLGRSVDHDLFASIFQLVDIDREPLAERGG